MRLCISRPAAKGFTLLELLIGMGLGAALLATTLYLGTQLQHKASWEAEALALERVGMHILQAIEEPLSNAGHGFGAAPLFVEWNGLHHRYAIDIHPCGSACQSQQHYGPYAAIAPDNLPDEIYMLSMAPNYVRGVVSTYVDPADGKRKYTTGAVYEKGGEELQWDRAWVYGYKEKKSTWGCGSRLPNLQTSDNTDVFYCETTQAFPCHCELGTFWKRHNYRDWRIGPLKESALRLNFQVQGPVLEFADPEYLTAVGGYASGALGDWGQGRAEDWKPMASSAIGLKAALGIPDPAEPTRMLWFPDADNQHPYIALCNPVASPADFQRCGEILDMHFGGLNADIDATFQHALMRRVRAVRLVLTLHSSRVDGRKIEVDASGNFVANPDGTFKNGRLSRRFERIVFPPSLRELGEAEAEADFAKPTPLPAAGP